MSTQLSISLFMFVLGLGLGMVMQVLVLAVQNAVEYKDLGVATSGATLFRSIGGSLGTAALGAIFSNRLSDQLKNVLPTGAHGPCPYRGQVNRTGDRASPTALRIGYLHAFTNWLNSVFLVAAAIAVVGWCSRGPSVSCRCVDGGEPDMQDTFASPRGYRSLRVIVNKLTLLERREGAREIIRRVARRAGVDLDSTSCWLLARLSEDARRPSTLSPTSAGGGRGAGRLQGRAAGARLMQRTHRYRAPHRNPPIS